MSIQLPSYGMRQEAVDMHEAYRDFYLARIQAAIGAAKASTGVSHRGMKGEIREILVKDLLRPLLPSDLGVGTGQIISALGETSSQQDIVLYDRRILPPLIFEERMGLFPIESVLFAIEIKSTLTAAELDKSNKAAEALLKFQLQSGRFDTVDQPMAHPLRRPVYAVFAFDSDLMPSGKTELERYRELCDSEVTLARADGPPVRLVCVVGRGCWTWMRQDWGSWQSTYPLQEVVRFVAIVMNTYREVARDRGEPRLGTYIL